jgi:hypothetical protein
LYRVKDALVPRFTIDYKDYSFLASYDITLSSLKVANNLRGGFEFGFIWNLKAGISSTSKPKTYKFIN